MSTSLPPEPDFPAPPPAEDLPASGGIVIHGLAAINGVADLDEAHYGGAPDPEDDTPKRKRTPRHGVRRRWPLIVVVGCLVLCCLCCILPLCLIPIAGGSLAAMIIESEAEVSGTETVSVGAGTVTLAVDNPIGAVTVEQGATQTVEIRFTKRAFSWSTSNAEQDLDAIQVAVTQPESNSVNVKVRNTDGPLSFANTVELIVRVPDSVALTITSKGGAITVRGVATEALRITTTTGAVTFEGVLGSDSQASYTIRTTTGALTVRLPADSTLQLDAETRVGSVTVDGFDVIGDFTEGSAGVGDAWSGAIGTGADARPTLALRSDTGAITVHGR